MRKNVAMTDEVIMNKIYCFRGVKMMVDHDLASLFGVTMSRIKRRVRKNAEVFPERFIFELNQSEFEHWRKQIGSSDFSDKIGLCQLPIAFTEYGILQLAGILKSKRARMMCVRIINLFMNKDKILECSSDLFFQLNGLEGKQSLEMELEKKYEQAYKLYMLQ